MQELFFTILIIWILFRIFNRESRSQTYTSTQYNYEKPEERKKEGEIKVEYIKDKKKKMNEEGEYVDYEEIK